MRHSEADLDDQILTQFKYLQLALRLMIAIGELPLFIDLVR
jgi:hypothetical protein